jgi:hypothetical protein
MEDDMMDIRGEVAYCKEGAEGKFENGIRFTETDQDKIDFLKQYITIFAG